MARDKTRNSRAEEKKKRSRPKEYQRVVTQGIHVPLLTDLYHRSLVSQWWTLLSILVVAYVLVNLFFALLYYSHPDSIAGARPGSFTDAFFFSAQTLSTVGYGSMAPQGIFGNILATTEAFLGLLSFAIGSGLMFAKFSRPTARVLFSDNVTIGQKDGLLTLNFRMANGRHTSQILEAHINVSLIKLEKTLEGENFRRIYDVELVRNHSPSFYLTWTAMHRIDETSPFYGETLESLLQSRSNLFVTFTGIEDGASQNVHARHAYPAEKILFNHRFVDVMSIKDDGQTFVDYSSFHLTKPEPT